MTGIDRVYCEVAIRGMLQANLNLKETTAEELLQKAEGYGKEDTLSFDAIPEIVIKDYLERFDPEIVFLTEEMGRAQDTKIRLGTKPMPLVFISDPTDRSFFLEKFLKDLGPTVKKSKFKEIISNEEMSKRWEKECQGGPVLISGATSAITGIKRGKPLFSVILNYITQHIFIACAAGARVSKIKDWSLSELKQITLEDIFGKGEEINFIQNKDCQFADYKKYLTFIGKTGYEENFENSKIFLSKFLSEKNLIYNQPGGPARILYLSSLYKEEPIGFILANGEKIIEWIHWLPYMATHQQGETPLRIFEIFYERPYTKEGILMAASPIYSIFSYDKEHDSYILNLSKLKDYPNPSRYRATLLVTFRENEWISHRMQQSQYKELKFRF